MGVRSRRSNKKRRRAATVSVGDSGGGVDLISGLNDDLLLRILDLVPDAKNVVRTHALSRRWRGLWTGVAALRFDYDFGFERYIAFVNGALVLRATAKEPLSVCRSDAAAERYVAFVNGALALRAAAKQPAFVEDLAISFDISRQEAPQVVPFSVEAAQGWIRYAVQHVVKSFILKLRLPWPQYDMELDDNDIEHPVTVITLDEMDDYAKMETMHLRLGGAGLRLPSSTLVFPSLIDLSLEDIEVGGYLLSRLVSSACCPRLHKLRLRQLIFEFSTMGVMLRIESGTLLELSLESMLEMQFLELRTPSLQVLHIDKCYDLNSFRVSAPRLENLKFWAQKSLNIDDVHGQLSSVGTLNIEMFSRGNTYDEGRNDSSIHLLQCCRLTRCLEVSFGIPKTNYGTVDIIKGKIPLLPDATHLTVHIILWEPHSIGPGVACLLSQCNNIKYLSLRLCYIITERKQLELDLLCDNNSCHWRSHEFSLDHLQEVEFKDLIGTDCEFQFIQSILTKATGIQNATISFNQLYWTKGRKHAFKLMPPLDGGQWTTCRGAKLSYKWIRSL